MVSRHGLGVGIDEDGVGLIAVLFFPWSRSMISFAISFEQNT